MVSVKPDGSAFGGGEGASYLGASEDGSAVAFSVGGTLYLHREGRPRSRSPPPPTPSPASPKTAQRVFYAATAEGEIARRPLRLRHRSRALRGPRRPRADRNRQLRDLRPGLPRRLPRLLHLHRSADRQRRKRKRRSGRSGQTQPLRLGRHGNSLRRQALRRGFRTEAFAGISEMNLAAWTRAIGRRHRSRDAPTPRPARRPTAAPSSSSPTPVSPPTTTKGWARSTATTRRPQRASACSASPAIPPAPRPRPTPCSRTSGDTASPPVQRR